MPKRSRIFFSHLMTLLVSLRGRFTFVNLSRYGLFNEVTYRYHFAKAFDFMTFNGKLIDKHCSDERIIAFDPSYLPKSGKHTYGLGRFWRSAARSGCAQQVKKGLELAGFSCIDLKHWTALHLYGQQTVLQEGQSLMDFYISLLRKQAKNLLKVSHMLCVDAYFSKYNYVKAATGCGFTLVSRLRNDAVLRYLYTGSSTGKKGRPKTYDGLVDKHPLRKDVFECFVTDQDLIAYQGVVYIKALKITARVVMLPQEDKNGVAKTPKVFFATDTSMNGAQVLSVYKARFQCEFLYRDANRIGDRQHTGLTQAQCRSKEKMHFHPGGEPLNASLTAVSVAKAVHYFDQQEQPNKVFSMADIKTQYINELLLNRFIDVFGIDPEHEDNYNKIKSLYHIGRMAA